MMRVLTTIAAFALALVCTSPRAGAKELPPEIRAMAARAFLEGRYEDVETTLVGATSEADRFPLELYRTWWRLADGAKPAFPPPTTLPGGGGAAWDLIDALRMGRSMREMLGGASLPGQSPLMGYRKGLDEEKDAEAIWFLEDVFRLMAETYGEPEPLPAKELRHYQRLRDTAKITALASLGAFLVLCFFGALLVVGRRGSDRVRRP